MKIEHLCVNCGYAKTERVKEKHFDPEKYPVKPCPTKGCGDNLVTQEY